MRDCIFRLRKSIPAEYELIITADHGGHGRHHGTDCDEDMIIPIILNGDAFEKGKELETASIKDIAPTITALMGAEPAREWEGKALV